MQWPFEYFIGLLALGPGELDEMAGSISKESCSRKSESCIIRLESKERQQTKSENNLYSRRSETGSRASFRRHNNHTRHRCIRTLAIYSSIRVEPHGPWLPSREECSLYDDNIM